MLFRLPNYKLYHVDACTKFDIILTIAGKQIKTNLERLKEIPTTIYTITTIDSIDGDAPFPFSFRVSPLSPIKKFELVVEGVLLTHSEGLYIINDSEQK